MDNFNSHYNDCYFSCEGGLDESVWVFIKGNSIGRFNADDDIYAGETGFGTGLNFLMLCDYINREIPGYQGTLDYFSCEKYPLKPEQINKLLSPFFVSNSDKLENYLDIYRKFYSTLAPGINRCDFNLLSVSGKLTLYYGDASEGLDVMENKRDVWFLDGHDPEKNPDMWSSNIFNLIGKKSHKGSTLATYTAKGFVKQGLRDAGFFIKRKKGCGKKRHMIYGEYQ